MSDLPIFDHATLDCASLSDAIPKVLDLVARTGRPVYVRGELNLEVLGVDIAIRDPTNRLPVVAGRRTITVFCLVEFMWYCAQRTDLEPLEIYAPNIRSYYGGMRSVTGSDYGRQLFGTSGSSSQWDNVVALLRHDAGSKRAFISMFDSAATPCLVPTNLDVSCTTGFQVLVRDGKLHWVTSMRANDAYRGFVSDTFSFTMLQELLASTVDIRVGSYLHRPTSLHTFPEDESAITKILGARRSNARVAPQMPSIQHQAFWKQLPAFWKVHDRCRAQSEWSGLAQIAEVDDPWWRWVIDSLLAFHDKGGASRVSES